MYIPFFVLFSLFHFVSDFTLSTFVHFYILHFYSPVLLLLLQTQTTPKKGRDIIPDILDPVSQSDPTLMNRAFWRQNTTLINPRLLAPNYLEPFIGIAPPLFLFSIRFFDPDQPFLLCI